MGVNLPNLVPITNISHHACTFHAGSLRLTSEGTDAAGSIHCDTDLPAGASRLFPACSSSSCSLTMSQTGRSLPDMRARDIRRRVDVIQKKLSDLQELGVPCAFCYSSVRNTGSLFTLGDHRITEVMERHKNEILKNLIESRHDVEGGNKKEIHLILPPLPAPLEELNRSMMQSLIVGILKDLGLRWSDPKPQWWPLDIPFFPPRSVPDSFKGNWTQALKRVIESVYSFFSYDVNTYIAGNLEVDVEEADTGAEGEMSGQKKDGEDLGEGGSVSGGEFDREDREGGVEGERGEDGDEGGGEETDDGDVCKEHDTSAEDEAFEEEGEESRLDDGQRAKDVSAQDKTNVQCLRKSGDSLEHHNPPHSPSSMSPTVTSHKHQSYPQQSKTVSSFTVENILMGSTSRSGSSSSSSPGSASHAPTTTFLPFPSHSVPIAHGGGGPAGAVSPSLYGWTSHPPVKYTKFTMVSPSSMRSGGDRRKRGERGLTIHSDPSESGGSNVTKAPTGRAGTAGDSSTTTSTTRCKEEPVSPTSSSPHTRTPTHSSSQHPSLGYHHSVIQTAIPLSRQSSAQSASDASPRGGHMSPSSTMSIPYAASQSPQQHQQYVVFFPPNFTLMASPSDVQVIGQTSSPQLYIQNTSQSTLTNHHQTHQHTSSHSSTSPSSPPSTTTVPSSDNPSTRHSLATAGMPHIQTSTSAKLSDPRFHPIAPKTDSTSIGFRTVKEVMNDRALRKRGPKPHLPVDKMKMKKMMPKPKKLRFHMTTVVKKVKRRTTSVSMTAPPPSICNRAQDQGSKGTEASPSDNHVSQDITKTPNVHTKSVANDSFSTTSTVTSSPTTAMAGSKSSPALSPEHSTQHDSKQQKNVDPLETSSSKNIVDSHSSPTNSPAHPHTTVLKDSGFHLQLVKQSVSQPQSSAPVTATSSPPAQCVGRGRGRGRGTRGYTRRKRELTFHLYEDPTTSFRPKRTRQQS